jgi:hypothetical protein
MGSGTSNACPGSSDGVWEASIPQRIVLCVLVEVWISIIENEPSTAADPLRARTGPQRALASEDTDRSLRRAQRAVLTGIRRR